MMETQTLFIVNEKGGVGKSTVAWNLGWVLCDQGKKVLLIDTDKQRSLSLYPFADDESGYKLGARVAHTLSECLSNPQTSLESVVSPSGFAGLDIVCADKHVEDYDSDALAAALCSIIDQASSLYDYVLVDFRRDFGSTLTQVVKRGLERVHAIVPVRSEESFSEGLATVVADLAGCCDFKVLFSQVYRPNDFTLSICDDVALGIMDSDFPNVERFSTLIRSTPKVGEATYYGRPVPEFYPSKKIAREYFALGEEVRAWCERTGA